ncbi:MAG: hypothetical protein IMF18_03100 [Proteobacteria bacterium]|nr:hypothetical protein [Pseudomonadota bacterium]
MHDLAKRLGMTRAGLGYAVKRGERIGKDNNHRFRKKKLPAASRRRAIRLRVCARSRFGGGASLGDGVLQGIPAKATNLVIYPPVFLKSKLKAMIKRLLF